MKFAVLATLIATAIAIPAYAEIPPRLPNCSLQEPARAVTLPEQIYPRPI